MNLPINFIHIPKTAGTSFRVALEKKYGSKNILRDYTPRAAETSKKVKEIIYSHDDFYALKLLLSSRNFVAIAGHYFAEKYSKIIPVSEMVAFVREPVSRIISEHNHFIRHAGYQKSLIEFAQEKININKQSRYLQGIPYTAIGLVGVTEYYSESINLFNKIYKKNIVEFRDNQGPNGPGKSIVTIDNDIIDEIKRLNIDDIVLYEKLVALHKQRIKFFKARQDFTYGGYKIVGGRIEGWAYQANNNKALTIEIFKSKLKVCELTSNKYNLELAQLGSPRSGYIGFYYNLKKSEYKAEFICVVKETGQRLSLI
ncbi:sulfotransferase family 2 domain-containing protein [Colwellia sp. RSH04]|uniref:sulfotransferase family 2 domain-containing protein n=1 Tax=Colwellia sp. RSH04 TaxID=2305464 RepID=UPI000E587CAB|nr:sulfotransferase family 2 domain-containing protein [Colwellia sp. RSH04]RHW74887.1 hypothetical protein D1094_16560 [Colwellia sp. RSH04]